MIETRPTIDETDPIVAAMAWAITSVVSGFLPKDKHADLRRALPTIALISAIGVRAAIDALDGEPVNGETVLRALGAAGVAVLAHSQAREVSKARQG